MRLKRIILAAGLIALCGCSGRQEVIRIGRLRHALCRIPARGESSLFLMGSTEITAAEYAVFLTENKPVAEHPQIRCGEKVCKPVRGQEEYPVAHVSAADAENFCFWLSRKTGRTVRLPDAAEWEYAARGGINGADFPWGWGSPENNAHFNADGPAACGQFSPNPYGLQDMAGNVAEWCAAGKKGERYALGGSWAERSADMLHPDRRTPFPPDYRDADVGFRILVEP